MIVHIVLLKLIDPSPENATLARDLLLNMKGKIPSLRYLETGINIVPTQRSYDLALVTKFDSLEDLKAYQTHPVHVEVLKYLTTVTESIVTADYESSE
ncbi:MAG: Dabb family protein [Firmicutes bacterium]|nr:Dabb family protein [Bacillota bacterium]